MAIVRREGAWTVSSLCWGFDMPVIDQGGATQFFKTFTTQRCLTPSIVKAARWKQRGGLYNVWQWTGNCCILPGGKLTLSFSVESFRRLKNKSSELYITLTPHINIDYFYYTFLMEIRNKLQIVRRRHQALFSKSVKKLESYWFDWRQSRHVYAWDSSFNVNETSTINYKYRMIYREN